MKQHTVQQVTAWKTSDGELHETAAQANAHSACLQFQHWYRYNSLHTIGGDAVDSGYLSAWLADNRSAVLDLLMARTEGERHAV